MKLLGLLLIQLVLNYNLYSQKEISRVLAPVQPNFSIMDVKVLSSNTIEVRAYNSGSPTLNTKWKIDGYTNWIDMTITQYELINNNTQGNIRNLFLTTIQFQANTNYTFMIQGSNEYGSDSKSFTFNSLFTNKITSWGVSYPIDQFSELSGLNENKFIKTINYSNGIGREIQNIQYRISPTHNDVLTPIYYDKNLQNSKTYLAYTSNNNNGAFRYDAYNEDSQYYLNTPPTGVDQTNYCYAEKIYERSPLFRTLEQGFTGANYQPSTDHTIRTSYETNTLADNVLILGVLEGTNATITIENSYYPAGTLYKTKTTDENQVVSYLYKDKNDKDILKVTMDGTTPIKTYYVYDKFNRLRFIIPPAAIDLLPASGTVGPTHQARVSYITEYKYDGLNREVEKIMPEEEPVWTVYDPAGRVVLRQDGIMRVNNDWLFTKYDRKGRVIMTGIWNQMGYWENRDEAQLNINTNVGVGKTYSFYEEHTVQDAIGYTNNAFPPNGGGCTIYTINYYDDYDFDNNGTIDAALQDILEFPNEDEDVTTPYENYKIIGHSKFDRITDKITMKKVLLFGAEGASRVFEGDHDYEFNPPSPETIYYHGSVRLKPGFKTYPDQKVYIGPNVVVPPGTSDGDGEYLATTYFYDKYGRVIQTQSTNHIGGTDVSSTQYEFAGKVIRTKLTHTTGYKTVTVNDRFTYDHTGRLIDSYKKIDNGTELLVSKNEYNELGQLITKKLGLTSLPSFLQTVDYRYNIRGWLKSVNDPYALSSDVFAFKLYYNDAPEYEVPYSAKYNGNITSMVWADNSNPNAQNAYSYYYDNLNRLNDANYGTVNGNIYDESNNYREFGIDYDKNGNIQHIKRNNGINGQVIDDLSYSYNGNKLKAVEDNPVDNTRAYDFKNGSTLTTEYEYDPNGNMKQDKNKGINITYNYLNLPVTISWNANNVNDKRKIEWLYDATGSKLRKTVYNTDGEATMVTDYVNGFVYNTNFGDALPQLSFFPMSEGRVVSLGGSNYELQYWLKDHLGNTRVAFKNFNDQAQVIQKDFYYPFGLNFKFGTQIGDENKFKYNGKELEDEHGLYWYHYGVRYYDPQLGRWHTMDPADEFHSPYLYVGNNPIKFLDPDGSYSHDFIKDNYYLKRTTLAGGVFHSLSVSTVPPLDLIAQLFPQDPSLIDYGVSSPFNNSITEGIVTSTFEKITGSSGLGKLATGLGIEQAFNTYRSIAPNLIADQETFNYALTIQRKGTPAFQVGDIIDMNNGVPIFKENANGSTLRLNPKYVDKFYGGDFHKAFNSLNSDLEFDNTLRKRFGPDFGLPEYSDFIENIGN